MNISENGLRMIEGFEGFVDHRYDDGTGVMTIGYGTTAADVSPLPTSLTQPEAERLLREKLARKYEPAVNGLGVPLNQNEFDALVSLVYNCGPGAMQWQIGRDLRALNYAAAANDFNRYVVAGGSVLAGLVRRRAAERALFLTPVAPDPYAIFEDALFTFTRNSLRTVPQVLNTFFGAALVLNERATVQEYDRLKHASPGEQVEIVHHQAWCLVLRKRIWQVAHNPLGPDGKPTWGIAHRGARWAALLHRTADLN